MNKAIRLLAVLIIVGLIFVAGIGSSETGIVKEKLKTGASWCKDITFASAEEADPGKPDNGDPL